MNTKRRIPAAVTVSAVILLVLCAAAALLILRLQDQYIFYPNLYAEGEEYLGSNDQYREILIENPEGGNYHGWFRPGKPARQGKEKPLLIYFGGNVQTAAGVFRGWEDRKLWHYFGNYSVLMVDYPGYGRSEGTPGEKSILPMTEAVYDYGATIEGIDPGRIVVMGFSIGTGPATYLASVRPAAGLILVAPYDKLINMYNLQMDIFHGPMELLVKNKFDSEAYAASVKVAPLVIASKNDEVIPFGLSENLARAFPATAELLTVETGADGAPITHTQMSVRKGTFEAVNRYLKER